MGESRINEGNSRERRGKGEIAAWRCSVCGGGSLGRGKEAGVGWGLGACGKDFEAHSWSQKNINLNAYFSASGEKEREKQEGGMSRSEGEVSMKTHPELAG